MVTKPLVRWQKDGQKRISKLEEQIVRLEKMLGRLGGLEDEALPLLEQLKVIEVVGRSAVRVVILIQTQQEISCAIWYEEDRLYQRELRSMREGRRAAGAALFDGREVDEGEDRRTADEDAETFGAAAEEGDVGGGTSAGIGGVEESGAEGGKIRNLSADGRR